MRLSCPPLLLLGALLALPATAGATDLATRLSTAHPLVCAHRGWLSPDEAENSLASFRRTEAAAPFMLEMDLAETRDRRIVLMHDARVDRTTDGHGPVSAFDAAGIARLHLRPRSGPVGKEAPPPFAKVLAWAARNPDVLLMLDIKKTPPADAMAAVRAAGMTGRVLLLTFDPDTAARAFAADPAVLVSVLVTDMDALARYRQMAGTGRRFAAYIPATSDAALFRAAHQAGAVVVTDLLDRKDALAPGADPSVLTGKTTDIVVSNQPQDTQRRLAAR